MLAVQPILRSAALRTIEQAQRDASPPLMERAGRAAAQLALRLLAGETTPGPVVIVAGPGNNGGDAFVVARLLQQAGVAPLVVFAGQAASLPPDARAAHDAWLAIGGKILDDIPPQFDIGGESRPAPGLIVDGLFGIGLTRAIEGRHASLIDRINRCACPRLALDVPSGVDADTGRTFGSVVHATHTATFIALKPGLLTLDGPDRSGIVSVHDLGLGADLANADAGLCVAPALFDATLRRRHRNTHKGSYGSAGLLGGAAGMAGAALLAARAALFLGAGRVYVGMLERIPVDPLHPELMLRPPEDIFPLATCLAIGPGLGQSDTALRLLHRAVDAKLPLLLDADALNLLAAHPVIGHRLSHRRHDTVLTPHPAEAARLLGCDLVAVQQDRVDAACRLARQFRAAVVLKGCGSIVACPDGRWFINTSGNPGLATAGAGDVLSGMVLALLAQGWTASDALLAAVHLHGRAADALVGQGVGPLGLTASELPAAARRLMNEWIAQRTVSLPLDDC